MKRPKPILAPCASHHVNLLDRVVEGSCLPGSDEAMTSLSAIAWATYGTSAGCLSNNRSVSIILRGYSAVRRKESSLRERAGMMLL